MSCGDAALLREALQRLDGMEAQVPETTPLRLQPVIGLRGHLAWLEVRPAEAVALWRQALLHEEACNLFGLAHELRTRLALQALHERALTDAAAWLRPMLQAAADGPRGALVALPAMRELAAAPWGAQLDGVALATLRTWAAAPSASDGPAVAPAASSNHPLDDVLTARETEVLSLMARGMSNKLIARELDLSPHTIKRHVAHVLDKLDLASRSQAAAWYHARMR